MLRSLRAALARFAVRRAAACQRFAPKRADLWLRLGCGLAPVFAEPHAALVHLRRAVEDRWGALGAARAATDRFPTNPDAWMLLGEPLVALQFAGGAVVLFGIYLARKASSQ